jgi:hypothetical protein
MRLAVLAAAAWWTLAACGAPATHIARGEVYATGNGAFDDFFTSVREVRSQALAAPDDADAAHASLLKALGLDAKAATSQALDEAGKSAKKLQDKGVLLHLEIAPEPKVLAARGKVDLGADGEALLKAMEGSVKSSLETQKRLVALAARAADLEKKRADLRSQAPDAFRADTPTKRDEIIAELDAAKRVLADAGDGATRAAGAASRFVVDLVQVVETGGAAEPAGKLGRGKKGFAGAPKAGGGPKATGPVATPPPRKKPKGADDFEP